jgi:hypothetical protein
MQQTRTTFTEVSGAGSLVHVCELILDFQTSMVTMTVETFLAWTPALRSRKLRQKLPRPPPRLRIHQSRLEPRHHLRPLPLLTARRTTHARRPRSPSPLTQKPPSQRRTVPDLPHMHPRMGASTMYRIHPLLALAQIRIPLSKSKRSDPMPALGLSTRFLLTPMGRPQAHQRARLRQAVLRRYRLLRLFGLQK